MLDRILKITGMLGFSLLLSACSFFGIGEESNSAPVKILREKPKVMRFVETEAPKETVKLLARHSLRFVDENLEELLARYDFPGDVTGNLSGCLPSEECVVSDDNVEKKNVKVVYFQKDDDGFNDFDIINTVEILTPEKKDSRYVHYFDLKYIPSEGYIQSVLFGDHWPKGYVETMNATDSQKEGYLAFHPNSTSPKGYLEAVGNKASNPTMGYLESLGKKVSTPPKEYLEAVKPKRPGDTGYLAQNDLENYIPDKNNYLAKNPYGTAPLSFLEKNGYIDYVGDGYLRALDMQDWTNGEFENLKSQTVPFQNGYLGAVGNSDSENNSGSGSVPSYGSASGNGYLGATGSSNGYLGSYSGSSYSSGSSSNLGGYLGSVNPTWPKKGYIEMMKKPNREFVTYDTEF